VRATVISMSGNCEVKGSIIKGLLYYMEKKWGKQYMDTLNLSFSPDEIRDGKYYPYSMIREVHRHLLEKTKGREEQGFRQAGKSVVEVTLEGKFFINYVVRKRPLEKTFANLLKAWEDESFRGVFKGDIKKDGNKIIITLDQICEGDKGEEVCWLNLGGMEGVVKVSGKDAVVKHTHCVFHGDEHCVYEIELKD
jgi:predicted hydrocarbon binding protein